MVKPPVEVDVGHSAVTPAPNTGPDIAETPALCASSDAFTGNDSISQGKKLHIDRELPRRVSSAEGGKSTNIGEGVSCSPMARTEAGSRGYRVARKVDGDIMATMIAEVRPISGCGGASRWERGASAAAHADDARIVRGAEMEWGLKCSSEQIADGAYDADMLTALKKASTGGVTLVQLQHIAGRVTSGVGGAGGKLEQSSLIGRILRDDKVLCYGGAEDVRYAPPLKAPPQAGTCRESSAVA